MNFVSIGYIFMSQVSDFAGLPSRNEFILISITFGRYNDVILLLYQMVLH